MSGPIDPVEGLGPRRLPNPFDLPERPIPPPLSPDFSVGGRTVRSGAAGAGEGNPLGHEPKLRASDVPVGGRTFKCAENGGRVAWAWGGDTEWNPTLEFFWKGLNVAVMSAGVASAMVSIARIGQVVRESIGDAAAAEFTAEIRKLRHDVESHAQDLEARTAELLRRANRLERKLEELLKAREARQEAAGGPAAAIRASLERKSEEVAEAVAGFKRRIRDILDDKREGVNDDGRRG